MKKRPPFKTKLPVLSNIRVPFLEEKSIKSPLASPSAFGHLKSVKPWHDPFFYISKGKPKLAPALPPGPSLPRSPPSTRSSRVLETIKSLNKLKSLERLQEPKQIQLRVPKKVRRFAIKNLNPVEKWPQSFHAPTPVFQTSARPVNSAEDYLSENDFALYQEQKQAPSQLAEATFRVIKW